MVSEEMLAAAREVASGVDDSAFERIYLAMKAAEPPVVAAYEELLFAVAQKHEGETRHETALRYIRERENRPSEGPFASLTMESGDAS